MKENRFNELGDPDVIYGEPPTMEEVAEMFKHGKGCSNATLLRKVEVRGLIKTPEGPYNLRLGPEFVRTIKTYLICDGCGVQEQYIG